MTDRRAFWSRASTDEIAQMCAAHGLRRDTSVVRRAALPVVDLFSGPDGGRDRQLLRGQAFTVHAVSENGWAYGERVADSYSGWVRIDHLVTHPDAAPTHRITTAKSYAKTTPGLKAPGPVTPLSMGSELVVLDESKGWSRIAWSDGPQAKDLFIPSVHLSAINHEDTDPVAVAERLIGTPYLWGGNSAFGIDCSGLVQIACHACGIACPGDSDQQTNVLGESLPQDTPPRRRDLMFWKGHVGWVAGPDTLLHANAYHMAVSFEPLQAAVSRIQDQGEGPVLRHARLTLA